MENVERSYAVVGVLEEMSKTFKVFENYIPRFFGDIQRFKKNETENATKAKPQLAPIVREKLEAHLKDEITFYEFCRQRLHKQFLAVDL